ncbi:hypothetical protein D9758_015216 [Tetrapyrgos nigripes]|uniref:Uncharacterized protein n=1 Tax=Tetrapyrgos nigripes TaxID=182062 RepID=A0A8H5CKG4_9AGAR|nr:hypothetical protein D9758_015216 [Tetrapyrgos nigripes]
MVTPFHTLKAARFLELLRLHTGYPIWNLLLTIRNGRRLALSQALHNNKVPLQTYEQWKKALNGDNIALSLDTPQRPLPSWLVLYLIAYKVRSPPQAAHSMLELAHASLSSPEDFPLTLHPGLIILTMLSLSRFNMVPQMQPLISRFLGLPELVPSYAEPSAKNPRMPSSYYNILLLSMTSTPNHLHSTDLANALLSLLKSMHTRRIGLWATTRAELLQDRYLILELTTYLRSQSRPTKAELERDLTVFGPLDDPLKFSELVSRELALKNSNEDRPSAFDFLRAMVDPKNLKPVASDAIRSENSPWLPQGPQTIQTMHEPMPGQVLKPTLAVLAKPHTPVVHARPSSSSWTQPPLRISWSEAFTAAARDTRTVTGDMLVFFFEQAFRLFSSSTKPLHLSRNTTAPSPKSHHIIQTLPPPPRPSVANYTTLLNGLLARCVSNHDHETTTHHPNSHLPSAALKYWNSLTASGLMLDGRAVGVGARVLIMQDDQHSVEVETQSEEADDSGSPAVVVGKRGSVGWGVCAAWELLEDFCGPGCSSGFQRLALTTISLNDILVSLNRVGRPDVVMRLWDGWVLPGRLAFEMGRNLAGKQLRFQGLHTAPTSPPDSRSLCILIQSVRLAGRLDGGLIGSWRQWRELHRLRSLPGPNAKETSARKGLVKDVETLLWARSAAEPDKNGPHGRKRGRPRGYLAGTVWRGQLPIERMRQIMRGIVWGAGAQRANAAGMNPSRRAGTGSEGESDWMQELDLDPPARSVIEMMYPDRWRILPPLPTLATLKGLKDLFSFKSWIQETRSAEVTQPVNPPPRTVKPPPQLSSASAPIRSKTSPSLLHSRTALTPEVFQEYILLLGTATSSPPFLHQSDGESTSSSGETLTQAALTSPVGLAPSPHPYHPEIPIALAWMRHLGIKPKKDTLAVSLVFWGEVTVPSETLDVPPLSYSKGPQNRQNHTAQSEVGEYERLVRWIKHWIQEMKVSDEGVDVDVMPTMGDLAKWRGIVRRIREGRGSWWEELMEEGLYGESDSCIEPSDCGDEANKSSS